MSVPQGDVCPLCGHRGHYLIPPPFSVQVMCVNDDCGVFMWDADATLEELLADVSEVTWNPPLSTD